jgi:lambda repressor-like predicted transcriptional regulator
MRAKKISYRTNKKGCHICTSHRPNLQGYPTIRRGKLVRMNRFVWEKTNGPIPKGMLVCHSCDNKRCINPEHLHLGTHKSNLQEAIDRGLCDPKTRFHSYGESRYNSKLTEEVVKEIHSLIWKRGDCTKIAKRLGVDVSTIWKARHGKAWKHVKKGKAK